MKLGVRRAHLSASVRQSRAGMGLYNKPAQPMDSAISPGAHVQKGNSRRESSKSPILVEYKLTLSRLNGGRAGHRSLSLSISLPSCVTSVSSLLRD